MKKTSLLFLMLFFFSLLFAQEPSNKKSPDEQIKVEKEFDESGNIIRYDSTYVRSWSSDTSGVFNFDLDNFFGGGFFSDSLFFGDDPFKRFQEHFNKPGQQFFERFGMWDSDTTHLFPNDSLSRYPDFGQLRREMMDSFQHFFQNDSSGLFPGQNGFNFFFDEGEFERLRKEMEQQFEQVDPGDVKPQKMKSSVKI